MELRRNRTQLQEVAMITALVRFRLPQGTSREDAKAMFEKSAPNYRGIPGLVRKYYLYGDDQTGGGVYLWSSRDAAERFYSDSWRSTIAQRYGAQPEILFFETPVIVENAEQNAATAAA
jgi:hypothetical protein